VAYICQEAALRIEQVLQSTQRLVEGVDQLTYFIVCVAFIGDAPGKIVCPGDLQRNPGHISRGARAVPVLNQLAIPAIAMEMMTQRPTPPAGLLGWHRLPPCWLPPG